MALSLPMEQYYFTYLFENPCNWRKVLNSVMHRFPVQRDRNFRRPSHYTFTCKHIEGYASFKTMYEMLPSFTKKMQLRPNNNYQYVPGRMAPYVIDFILEMRLTSVGKNVNGSIAYYTVRHALLCKTPYTRSTKPLKSYSSKVYGI